MKRLFLFALFACFAGNLFAADTLPILSWEIETARPAPVTIPVYSGETVWLKPSYKTYSEALTLSNATSVVLRYRTSDMDAGTFYYATGAVDSATSGRVAILWTPALEGTNSAYTYNILVNSASGTLARSYGSITIADMVSGSPALTPSSDYARRDADLTQFTALGGTNGQVWISNGSGSGAWGNQPAGLTTNVQFLVSGTATNWLCITNGVIKTITGSAPE